MCGIAAVVGLSAKSGPPTTCKDWTRLRRRGPDSFASHPVCINEAPENTGHLTTILLAAAVLHMRGPNLFVQPAKDEAGNILLWNGELYSAAATERTLNNDSSDTKRVLQLLSTAKRQEDILRVLAPLEGEWALIYWQARTKCLLFGRDKLGRRSLLTHRNAASNEFVISSVALINGTPFPFDHQVTEQFSVEHSEYMHCTTASRGSWVEITTDGIYSLNFSVASSSETFQPNLLSWDLAPSHAALLPERALSSLSSVETVIQRFLELLYQAVAKRTVSVAKPLSKDAGKLPHLAVLFSGGLDSTVLAALAHKALPLNDTIDLINVCFDSASGYNSPDRIDAYKSATELQALFPERAWRFICVNVSYKQVMKKQDHIWHLIRPKVTHMDFNIGAALWFAARGKGFMMDLRTIGAVLKTRHFDTNPSPPSSDCPTLGCLSSVEQINLGGCVFRRCRSCCSKYMKLRKVLKNAVDDLERAIDDAGRRKKLSIVDAITKKIDVFQILDSDELPTKCLFHEKKVGQLPFNRERAELANPRGISDQARAGPIIRSRARILLVGIGADEQLGGYGRHRQAYEAGGEQGLRNELNLDMQRLWQRNLGRDDRCISDNGKEARYPFLDEELTAFVQNLPLVQVVDFSKPRGLGDKWILRQAASLLGLNHATHLPKRAIQFGSRIARESDLHTSSTRKGVFGNTTFSIQQSIS